MESKKRRVAHYVGKILGLAVGYTIFVVTSPLLGIWIIWQNWHQHNVKNVVFADFRKKH